MAKQQSSETFKLPLGSGKTRQARGVFRLEVLSRFEAQTWVLVVVSLVTAYLVLPPSIQLSRPVFSPPNSPGNWMNSP